MKHPIDFAADAEALIARMDLDVRASLLSGSSFWHLQDVAEHGLPKTMVSDGPHGLRKQSAHADHLGMQSSVPATCFPTAVTLASSWDTDLIAEVGVAIGRECQAEDVAVLLGPGVNIKRSPLCGRNFEYYSEDPYLAGTMAVAFIAGVQSTGTGTSIKHFAVNNQEAQRMVVDTLVDARTLHEIYLPAFEIAVRQAQPWTVMCAYNRLNGSYCSENKILTKDILRDRWGFQGLVVTDWGAVNDRPQGVAAGLDLEMPGSGGLNDCAAADAVRAGVLEEADLNTAARNVTALILASENNSAAPEVDFDAHHALARRAAREGAVLLKNNDATLPFKKSGKLAVIGAFAEAPRFQGAGSSQVNATQIDKPLDMFAAALGGAGEVVYAKGFDPETAETDEKLIAEAVACAEAADQVIVMVGLPPLFEAEGFDREHLRQPAQLDALVAAVAKANPACAVVLSNGAPIEMPWIDTVPAVLEIYLAGQAGAGALCDLVFGEVSPSGKLAETFPLALNDCPAQENFATHPRQIIYREGLNVGYRHFVTHETPVLFPFGHGLSYTTFDYANLRVSGDTSAHGLNLEVRVDITNSGPCAGAEIVQLYVRDVEASVYRPDRELKAFRKLYLGAGETATCTLVLDRRSFAFFDIGADDWVVEPGAFELLVGASCTDIRQSINIDLNGDTRRNAPKTQETPYVTMTDNELAARGLHVTVAESVKPYHANTTLADIQHHWLGKRIVAMVFKAIEGTLGPTKTDSPVMIKMRNEMVLSMRLNTVRIMSGGALSEKRFRLLLDLLNNRWAHFFVELFRR